MSENASNSNAKLNQARKLPTKFIFVTGGVLSGVGKGITAASIGAILKAKGFSVSMQKCDPYLNVDAGLLNPVEHGECFVTHDGRETDLDLGHYERFLDFETNRYSAVLSGALYQELIEKERSGGFHGKTVQMVPHFTDLVMEKIAAAGKDSDIHIVEIGGTVGDYEGLSFIEAIRLFANRVGRENCLFVSVVFVPWINTSKELKTKPAQNALRDLRGFGIIPDVVVCRTEKPAPRAICEKIAAFSGIDKDAVLNLPDIESVYDVPFNVLKSGVLTILNKFVQDDKAPDMSRWQEFSRLRNQKFKQIIKVGLVAKYVGNNDAYISVTEALKAAAAWNEVNLETIWINAEEATDEDFKNVDGLVVPGGFGARGAEGKIAAATFALKNDKPYLGLCLGLQMACVAAARLGGIKNANSEEFGADEKNNVIYIMDEQKGKVETGGTMRLGDYKAKIKSGTKTEKAYKNGKTGNQTAPSVFYKDTSRGIDVTERHRHRFEVNQKFLPEIEKGGLTVSGTSPDGKLVEFVEAKENKFFIATQAHPELKSRPLNVHPLFIEFIKSLKI